VRGMMLWCVLQLEQSRDVVMVAPVQRPAIQ
jgi:hypothetical protein